MKKILTTTLALALTVGAFAQKSDGTAKSLVNAEKEFAKAMSKNGDKQAYLEYSSANALVFRPNPVNVKTFYNAQTKSNEQLSWTPNLAKVSRSGNWGFTAGTYELTSADKKYGQYLSIWKADSGKWKLELDLGTSNNKPLSKVENQFIDPTDHFMPKFINEKEIKANKEVILTNEKILNTSLKTHGAIAFAGFLTNNARLIFPGNEAINGKDKILQFFNGMVSKINLKTNGVDKSLGGDFAYTYGVATIDYKTDLRESFNYVFIYEKAADHSWNLIVQAFVPAER